MMRKYDANKLLRYNNIMYFDCIMCFRGHTYGRVISKVGVQTAKLLLYLALSVVNLKPQAKSLLFAAVLLLL